MFIVKNIYLALEGIFHGGDMFVLCSVPSGQEVTSYLKHMRDGSCVRRPLPLVGLLP